MEVKEERFVWYTNSKTKQAGFCYVPHQKWKMLPNDHKIWKFALAMEQELRSDEDISDMRVFIEKVFKRLKNEL